MNERAWINLMNKIREGNVIPIIGPQLLVEADGHTSLQARIAARLLQDCGMDPGEVPLPPFRELNAAVSQLKGSVDDSELYDCVNNAIHNVTSASDFAMPEPIRQLSQIADFRLFVTLTPDDLLARSLRQRCAANEIIHSLKLASEATPDLPEDWIK
ncbi:MAG: toll/interleukin-1 receptor domain-containing protein, partial [Steroidobacteraceae bacterium]|nr:toll/interleukin-1 receptor domain-containing protein [Deltaproteobacteria bacterium]